jgi:outer membrane scaffolding protein for murein synthesis (MipA/OmpV family)
MAFTHVLALAGLASLAAGAAQAQGWVVTIGGKGSVAPPYEGADHYVVRPVPTLSARRADRPYRFVPPDGGTTFSLVDTEHVVFGPMARFQYGRGNEGSLTGLKKVKWAAEPGVFLDLWPTAWLRAHGELRRGVVGHQGLVGDVGADLVHMSPRWDASIGPRFGYGNRRYFARYFGVTPAEAVRSPAVAEAYSPEGGRRYTGVELATAYHVTDRLSIRADAGYHHLATKAADSPIVRLAGSRHQYFGSLGVSYAFNFGR